MTLNNIFRKPSMGNMTIRKEVLHQSFDKEVKVSKHIPISHFVTPEIFSTKKGELGVVIKILGTPFDVKSGEELNHLQASQSFAIQNMSHEYSLYVTSHRNLQPNNLTGEYPKGFAQDFYESYSEQFRKAELFVNDIYITLIQKSSNANINKGLSLLQKFNTKHNKAQFTELHAIRLRKFQTTLSNFLATLSPYTATVLGEKFLINGRAKAEMLGFLSILVNGAEREYTYPSQSIASYVPEKRIFFGSNTIHFQGMYRGSDLFGAILSIKTYSPISTLGMLNGLLTVPFEYISTHSYLGIEKTKALKLIDIQIKRLQSTEDAAKSQIEELEVAKDDLASGRINYGFHHNTLMVLSDNLKDLEEKVAKIVKTYQDQRLVIIRETLNLENSFWAQIPGNFKYIRRSALISSNNLSCFCPLHNYYAGYINENHLGGALMLVETPSKTPLYLNLHEKASGRKDDLSRGHTLLIGPSNAGKTVIMTSIDAMFKKYQIRSFIFDRNLGCEIYIRAMGGTYHRLSPGEITHWNPCQINDTPKNRKFLRDLLAVLSNSQTASLSASDYRQIAEVVERNFTLPVEKRNLSNISSFFQLDFTGLDALSRYLRLPDRTGKAGDRAYLFDNDSDQLNFDTDTIGFDMTHWLSDAGQSPEELLPISMYLFHRMEERFDGKLTGIFLDEGWQFLQQPYWSEKIQEYLVTLRKCNVFLFLSTQLPDKLAESKLSSALIQGTATHIFLANPRARKEDYINSFKLSHREYQIIKNFSIQSRYFLIKQAQEAAIGRINLGGLEHHLSVLSGNEITVRLCEQLRSEFGDDPEKWLPSFYKKRVV